MAVATARIFVDFRIIAVIKGTKYATRNRFSIATVLSRKHIISVRPEFPIGGAKHVRIYSIRSLNSIKLSRQIVSPAILITFDTLIPLLCVPIGNAFSSVFTSNRSLICRLSSHNYSRVTHRKLLLSRRIISTMKIRIVSNRELILYVFLSNLLEIFVVSCILVRPCRPRADFIIIIIFLFLFSVKLRGILIFVDSRTCFCHP